jgi:hypothetical protein
MEAFEKYLLPYLISNLVFGLTLVAAIKRPMIARSFLALSFVGAGIFNCWSAIHTPESYLTYADLSLAQLYENFIRGYFFTHVRGFVIAIAIGQILAGLAMMLDNKWTQVGFIGGAIFGVAIAPLGIGSAFPSTIVMAAAFFVLMSKGPHDLIVKWNQYRRTAPN